jgi:hypothetical protein
MTSVRSLCLALLATLGLSLVATTTAFSAEGPFHKVEGKRLAKGESKAAEAK